MQAKFLRIATMVALLLAAMTMGQAQNVPINLEQGWNWISYPHSEPMTIEEALSGFTPAEGDVIKSQTGTTQYQNGTWIGSLTTLVPGVGYMYKSVDGSSRTFVFGGEANDPSALPNEALNGEFTVDANGTTVRFSPGNLQCRFDPNHESKIVVGTGINTTSYMPYYTYYCYSLCQMIYKASELQAAGLSAGPITGIAFESYSNYHYLRTGVKIWMAATTLSSAPSTSVSASGMTQVFNGSVTQQTGWTEIPFTSNAFTWDGTSNLMVTVVMNHGSWDSSTPWQCNSPGFTCCNYKYTDNNAYDPVASTYSMTTSTSRPNTRFSGRGGMTWSFAQSQTDCIGEANGNVSSTYLGLIDLFCWGTSGHPHGAVCYQPWSTSYTNSDYYAYGIKNANLYDFTGEADWGSNPISNGGNEPKQWRTLTAGEWVYLLDTRSTASGKRYAKAKVRGVNGVILLPDNWNTAYYTLNSTNSNTASFTSNIVTSADWQILEHHGAVFLPAAGYRYWDMIFYDCYDTNSGSGNYWSSSYAEDGEYSGLNMTDVSYMIYFSNTQLHSSNVYDRSFGFAVRLVCQTNPHIRAIGMTDITSTTAKANAEVDYTGSGTVTERGVCWNVTGAPTVSDSHLASGTGTGSFTVQLTGLEESSVYRVRAYAKIGDTYRYGNELAFITYGALSVTTTTVSDISTTYAISGGTVTDCGQNIKARGLCWGTSMYPTLNGIHSYDGTGTGSFTGIMNNLSSSATYHVRAYAITAHDTIYGNDRSFTTMSGIIDVTTASVTNITATTATCGGSVENNGGADITARGVCWSLNSTPTRYDSHTTNGTGTGSFTSNMSYLSPGTTYHVRAYAATAQGDYYGDERVFTTQSGLVEVTTATPSDVTTTTATCGGTVTTHGATVTARGVCWGTNYYPTVSGNHTTNGSGGGSFTSSITGLSGETTYYVRAYATTSNGTFYGNTVSLTTPPAGALNGTFSVSANTRVYFSQGNLQYSNGNGLWLFAEHQWDYIGEDNSYMPVPYYGGNFDLFGWGTSGFHHGAVCYYPYATSTTNSDYYAYGDPNCNLYDQTGQADWGYNAISNGGFSDHWRTLTIQEWQYVFNTRSTTSGIRFAKAKVNNVNGMILLPDNWSSSYYSLSNTNNGEANYSSNVISASQWDSLEQHGAVFLPAAGYRYGTSVRGVGSSGDYWSASYLDSDRARYVYFLDSSLSTSDGDYRYYGQSVRLVRVAE